MALKQKHATVWHSRQTMLVSFGICLIGISNGNFTETKVGAGHTNFFDFIGHRF